MVQEKDWKTPTEFKLLLLGAIGFSIAIHPLILSYFQIIDLDVLPQIVIYGLGFLAGICIVPSLIGAFIITHSEYAM